MLAKSKLSHSLKEWAIAISALSQGQTIMLLRKGGIREPKNRFALLHSFAWLYPTYEHQKPELLKPQYAQLVKEVPSGWHPETIEIQTFVEITHSFEIEQLATVAQLKPYYIWQESTIATRFKWKPKQPLSVLLLRASNLLEPVEIPYDNSYGGCKSWIELRQPITTEGLVPVLSEKEYQQQVAQISQIVAETE